MNVFLLHQEPDKAAKAVCDKHVNKMCLEAVQVANSGLHNADLESEAFYGAGYDSHPWSVFAGKTFDHFNFVRKHAHALGREFIRRYDSRHGSHKKSLDNWDHDTLTTIEQQMGRAEHPPIEDAPQCILEKYYRDDPIEAYTAYYYGEKWSKDWCFYQKADAPDWFIEDTPRERWA